MKMETSTKQDSNYVYDSIGNVMEINDTINTRQELMTYDDIARLIKAVRNEDGSQQYLINYAYNSIGNMLSISSQGNADNLTFYYNGSNPVHMPYKIT